MRLRFRLLTARAYSRASSLLAGSGLRVPGKGLLVGFTQGYAP